VLENALDRCMTEDVCTGEVSAALEYLATPSLATSNSSVKEKQKNYSRQNDFEKKSWRSVSSA
jgi:hypothetical protein